MVILATTGRSMLSTDGSGADASQCQGWVRHRGSKIGVARRQSGQSLGFAGLVMLVARDLELRESLQWVGRPEEHHVLIVAIGRFAWID